MPQQVSMDDVTRLIGAKELALTLLRSENQRLKDELKAAQNGHEETGLEETS